MEDVDRRGCNAITDNIASFCASNVDAFHLATRLIEKRVISHSLLDDIRSQQTIKEKLSIVLGAVLRNGSPGVYQHLVDCLSDEPSSTWLANKIKGIETFCACIFHTVRIA